MPGAIIHRGPSRINNAPIVAVAIWGSKNVKTGNVLQTYILHADLDPRDASKYGEDEAICGTCQHRGQPTLDPDRVLAEQRSCYVTITQGPLQVWRALQAGKYPLRATAVERMGLGMGRVVRLGTYGDPGAVPNYVWNELLGSSVGHTGYTHNGGDTKTCMVSADSLAQAKDAWAHNWRTFRILRSVGDLVRGKEVLCPASKEAGYKATCIDCKLCSGTKVRAKSVAIVAHGSGARHFG